MRFIGSVIDKLERHPKRIVFPEGTEPRVLQAARQFYSLRLGVPILLGDRTRIKEAAASLDIDLHGIRILDPVNSTELERFIEHWQSMAGPDSTARGDPAGWMMLPNYFGAMMVAMHQADGIVSGTQEDASSILQPLFQIIGTAPQTRTVSSCMVMEVEDSRVGQDGVLFMADCGVVSCPTPDELADIAVATALLARRLLGTRPRVALLSHSTRSRTPQPDLDRIRAAVALASTKAAECALDAAFEGELQVDAALVPEIARRKSRESDVAGNANVLVFPDLASGNIGSKLVQHLAHANAYGQILLGLNRPAADVSRGSSARDILGVAAIVGAQAIECHNQSPLTAPGSKHGPDPGLVRSSAPADAVNYEAPSR